MNKFCGNCGEKLIDNAKFCGLCGSEMNNLSNLNKRDFIKNDIGIEKNDTSKIKSKNNYYSIIGVVIVGLIFGSRAIWTSYKEQQIYELSVPVDYNDVRELFIDKNWKLMSFSNFSLTSDYSIFEKLFKSDLNDIINDNEAYMRFMYAADCEIDDMFLIYEQGWDDDFAENMYSVMLFKLTKDSDGLALYSEGNVIYSIGVGSQIENKVEGDFKVREVIVDIDNNSMKTHEIIEFRIGEINVSYEVDLFYEALEDGNESNMVNANYMKALEWFPYDCENFKISPPITDIPMD
jgi:hypothetical protein